MKPENREPGMVCLIQQQKPDRIDLYYCFRLLNHYAGMRPMDALEDFFELEREALQFDCPISVVEFPDKTWRGEIQLEEGASSFHLIFMQVEKEETKMSLRAKIEALREEQIEPLMVNSACEELKPLMREVVLEMTGGKAKKHTITGYMVVPVGKERN